MDAKTTQKLIDNLNKKQLSQLIKELVKRNEKAEQVLLDFCQQQETGDQAFVLEKQLRAHWKKAENIIASANQYGGCSYQDEDIAYTELNKIDYLVQNNEIPWKLRKEIFEAMIYQVNLDNSGFTDYLEEIAFDFCQSEDEQGYLAQLLEKSRSSYYRKQAAEIYKALGKREQSMKLLSENLEYANDYVVLAKQLAAKGEKEAALKTAWEGVEKNKFGLDGVYTYLFHWYEKENNEENLSLLYKRALEKESNLETITKLMYDHYKKKNDIPKKNAMLIEMVKCAKNIRYWYRLCREELPTEKFKKYEPELLKVIYVKDYPFYLDLCLERGNAKAVLQEMQASQSLYDRWSLADNTHHYSLLLAQSYPDEVLDSLWREVNAYVATGANGHSYKKNYGLAAQSLATVKKIMKSQNKSAAWETQFHNFCETHRRKRALMAAVKFLQKNE